MRAVPSESSTGTAIKVLQDPEATSTCKDDQTCSRWKPYSNSTDFERDAWLIFAVLFGLLFFAIGIHAVICCIIRRRRRSPRQTNGGGGAVVISSELNSTEEPKRIAASGGDAVDVSAEVLVFNSAYKLAADCAICLSEFEEGDRVMVLEGCKHVFHVNCIKEWLCAHCSCPICRATTSASSFSGIDLKSC